MTQPRSGQSELLDFPEVYGPTPVFQASAADLFHPDSTDFISGFEVDSSEPRVQLPIFYGFGRRC